MSTYLTISSLIDRVFDAISPAPWKIAERVKRQDYFGVAYKIQDKQGIPILKTPPVRPLGAPSRAFYNAHLAEMAPELLRLVAVAYFAHGAELGAEWTAGFEKALRYVLTPTENMPSGMFKG